MSALSERLHALAREYHQHRPHYEEAAAEIERLTALSRRPQGAHAMSLDEEIAFWMRATEGARSKELALLCFGIRAGLQMAQERIDTRQARC